MDYRTFMLYLSTLLSWSYSFYCHSSSHHGKEVRPTQPHQQLSRPILTFLAIHQMARLVSLQGFHIPHAELLTVCSHGLFSRLSTVINNPIFRVDYCNS